MYMKDTAHFILNRSSNLGNVALTVQIPATVKIRMFQKICDAFALSNISGSNSLALIRPVVSI